MTLKTGGTISRNGVARISVEGHPAKILLNKTRKILKCFIKFAQNLKNTPKDFKILRKIRTI